MEPDDTTRTDTASVTHIVEPYSVPVTENANFAPEPNDFSVISHHLPVEPPILAPESLQNLAPPGSENHGVPAHGTRVLDTIPNISAADDPLWKAFDGETDLMALFPDLPSLVSEQNH